jgi:hypothetical protein
MHLRRKALSETRRRHCTDQPLAIAVPNLYQLGSLCVSGPQTPHAGQARPGGVECSVCMHPLPIKDSGIRRLNKDL